MLRPELLHHESLTEGHDVACRELGGRTKSPRTSSPRYVRNRKTVRRFDGAHRRRDKRNYL